MTTRTNLPTLLEREFGATIRTITDPVVSSVGTSAVEFLRQDPNRVAFLIVNLGVSDLYVGLGPDVASTKGIIIGNSGGSMSVNYKEDGDLPGRSWWILSASGTVNFHTMAVVTDA